MRVFLAVALILGSATFAMAQGYGYGYGSNPSNHFVNPYTTSRGMYVPGHYQTNPNGTQFDNYGTRGNSNPYSGRFGTRSPRW